MWMQFLAIFACIVILALFLAFSERLADRLVDKSHIQLNNWRTPAVVSWTLIDLPLSLTVLIFGQQLAWVVLSLLLSGIGRAMIALGHSSASPAASMSGRLINIAGNVTIVWFPLIGALARWLLGS